MEMDSPIRIAFLLFGGLKGFDSDVFEITDGGICLGGSDIVFSFFWAAINTAN